MFTITYVVVHFGGRVGVGIGSLMELGVSIVAMELGGHKRTLEGAYFHSQDWAQAWKLVPQTGRSIFLTMDQQDLVGK